MPSATATHSRERRRKRPRGVSSLTDGIVPPCLLARERGRRSRWALRPQGPRASFRPMSARERIDRLVKTHDVVLFMKGTRGAPQCGFSARVVDLLDEYVPDYETVNVLADPEIREGIKEYSSWPTIPQLYVRGNFVGGCDIVTEMGQSGELATM